MLTGLNREKTGELTGSGFQSFQKGVESLSVRIEAHGLRLILIQQI